MNIEELLNNAVDCAINDETLQKVLISFLENGNVNCRVLALDEDKEVSKETKNTDVIRLYQLKTIKLILDKLRNDGGIKEKALSRLISNDEKDTVHSCNASLLKSVTLDDINYLNDLSVEEIKDILDGKMSIDENKYKLLKFIETYMANLTKDGNGKNSIFMSEEQYTERPLHFKNEAYTKRVYLNTPEGEDRYKFLYLYIQKCLERNIPFRMKGAGSGGRDDGDLDTTILYSNDFYFMEHIEVLEEIIRENKDMFSSFGSSVISGGRVLNEDGKSYYTIASGIPSRYLRETPNGFMDKTYQDSFLFMCMKYLQAKNYDLSEKLRNIVEENCDIDSSSAEQIAEVIIRESISRGEKKQITSLGIEVIKKMLSNNEVDINELIEELKNNVKQIASVSKFQDKEHLDVPIYMDDYFFEFYTKSKTQDRVENFEEKRDEEKLLNSEEIIDVLCGGTYRLKEALVVLGNDPRKFKSNTREELEQLYISQIGLDEVINAQKIIKEQEKESDSKRNHRYENTLQAMRMQRGKEIVNSEEFRSLHTPDEKRKYIFSNFSESTIEDILTYYETSKNIRKANKETTEILR